jgi:hypothetical protein
VREWPKCKERVSRHGDLCVVTRADSDPVGALGMLAQTAPPTLEGQSADRKHGEQAARELAETDRL